MPPIPEEYKRLKGCGHNQRPDPSPHGGNASYESRIFAVHLSRLPIRRAADPIDSPHNCCIEIYDCRGKSIFLREPVPNKRRIRP